MSASKKRELNFELDLLPVISMMSVCICFLLLTAVWTHVGSLNIAQGLGQESTRALPTDASLWIEMKGNGDIEFSLKDALQVAEPLRERTFIGGFATDWASIERHAMALKQALPGLKTALIMPDAKVGYGQVVKMMDRLKSKNISEVGIAPL